MVTMNFWLLMLVLLAVMVTAKVVGSFATAVIAKKSGFSVADKIVGRTLDGVFKTHESTQNCLCRILKRLDSLENLQRSNTNKSTGVCSFEWALSAVKNGNFVRRRGWNGKGMYLALQSPTDQSKMTLPYIYMKTADGNLVPWLASQTDMLSDDWELCGGTPAPKFHDSDAV